MLKRGLLLVTGASGFLGREVVRLALADGWQVRVLARRAAAQADVVLMVGDIENAESLKMALAGADAVVHAAGLAHVFGVDGGRPERFDAVNERGTANVLNAAVKAGVATIVVASSVSVYGACEGDACDETSVCRPQGPYAVSKRNAELRAEEIAEGTIAALVLLRFATIYGEGDRGNVMKLVSAIDKGRFVRIGSGKNQKSLIYKEDAARACLAVLNKGLKPGTYCFNVSDGAASMNAIMSAICGALRRSVPRLFVPESLLQIGAGLLMGCGDPGQIGARIRKLLKNDVYSSKKFEEAFGFETKTSLIAGMQKVVDGMRQ